MSTHTGQGEAKAYQTAVKLLHAIWHCQGCQARNRLTRELISECQDGAKGVFRREDGQRFIISIAVVPMGSDKIDKWDDPEI